MFYDIFNMLAEAFFGTTELVATSFEYLFTTGLAYACCLAVVCVPCVVVFGVMRLFCRW